MIRNTHTIESCTAIAASFRKNDRFRVLQCKVVKCSSNSGQYFTTITIIRDYCIADFARHPIQVTKGKIKNVFSYMCKADYFFNYPFWPFTVKFIIKKVFIDE